MVPLKQENERVVNENNDLHKEIIDVKEKLEANDLKWRNALRTHQSDVNDSKFVITQKDHKINELEDAIIEIKEAMNLR